MKGVRLFVGLATAVAALAYLVYSVSYRPTNQNTVMNAGGLGVADAAHDLVIGEPICFQNLTIFPVSSKQPKNDDRFITLDEALRAGVVEIFEKGAARDQAPGEVSSPPQNDPFATVPSQSPNPSTGSDGTPDPFAIPTNGPSNTAAISSQNNEVNELVVVNHSNKPLYLMPGEIIIGGSQDRIIGQELVIAPDNKPIAIDVFCVEHGRWGGRDERAYAGLLARASTIEAQSWATEETQLVPNSFQGNLSLVVRQATEIANGGKFIGSIGSLNKAARVAVQKSDGQVKVWEEVANENAKSGVTGESGTFAGNYAEAAPVERLTPYVKQFQAHIAETPNIVGVIVAVNGDIESMDTFETTPLFQKLWPKLLKSYALDAANAVDESAPQKLVKYDDARNFLAEVARLEAKPADTDGELAHSQGENDHIFAFSFHERRRQNGESSAAGAALGGAIHSFGGMH